jgi:hypothetical protein
MKMREASMSEEHDRIARCLIDAKAALKAKGWETPSVEIGVKVLGDYMPVYWAGVHLGSVENWVKEWDLKTLDETLAAISSAVGSVPQATARKDATLAALSKRPGSRRHGMSDNPVAEIIAGEIANILEKAGAINEWKTLEKAPKPMMAPEDGSDRDGARRGSHG